MRSLIQELYEQAWAEKRRLRRGERAAQAPAWPPSYWDCPLCAWRSADGLQARVVAVPWADRERHLARAHGLVPHGLVGGRP